MRNILVFCILALLVLTVSSFNLFPSSYASSSISDRRVPISTSVPEPSSFPVITNNGLLRTLKSPNSQINGFFGYSAATSGKLIVIGATGENGGADNAGAAYVFNTTSGTLINNLTSPNAQFEGAFGCSVSISGDLAVVGARSESAGKHSVSGHAYIFDAATGSLVWTLSSPNTQDGGFFGAAVEMSGNLVIVGAYGETVNGNNYAGHAYVFNATSGVLIQTLTSPNSQMDSRFGESVGISGNLVIVGAYGETVNGNNYAGHAYVFNATSGVLIQTLTSPNEQYYGFFGFSVALSGKFAIIGAEGETVHGDAYAGRAYSFNVLNGALIHTFASRHVQVNGFFSGDVAINGKLTIIGADYETVGGKPQAGRAYVFNAISGALIITLTSPHSQAGYFGFSVALRNKLAIVGAPDEHSNSGRAFLFKV